MRFPCEQEQRTSAHDRADPLGPEPETEGDDDRSAEAAERRFRFATSFTGWSLVCSMAEVALVFAIANYVWGLRAAILSGTVIALTPIHVILGSSPLADAPLAFFFSLALVSSFLAEQSGTSLFLCGDQNRSRLRVVDQAARRRPIRSCFCSVRDGLARLAPPMAACHRRRRAWWPST